MSVIIDARTIEFMQIALSISLLLFVFISILLFIFNKSYRHMLMEKMVAIIGGITYSESTRENNTLYKRVSILENELQKTKKELELNNIKDKSELIEQAVENYIENNIKNIVSNKVKELKVNDEILFQEIELITKKEVENFLKLTDMDSISKNIQYYHSMQRKRIDEKMLDDISIEQLKNSGKMKTVMINLFVFFNLGILMIYLFGSPSRLTSDVMLGILGLYISLAAFIIYIYRASNSRSSVVMAIREDSKKYYDVLDYLTKFKSDGNISEHDVDIIRMLTTSRSEREKNTEHPYEMIFKSVANSNIQFKGGKMSIAKGNKA